MKMARVNVALLPVPPTPEGPVLLHREEIVLCYFLFCPKGQSRTPDLRRCNMLSAFLTGDNQHREGPQSHEGLVHKDTGW